MNPLKNNKKSVSRDAKGRVKGQENSLVMPHRSVRVAGGNKKVANEDCMLPPIMTFKSHEFRTNEAAASLLDIIYKEISKDGIVVQVIDLPASHGGFFDPVEGVISVASGLSDEETLGVLAHEFCHFRQWRDRSSLYVACQSWGDSVGKTTAGVGAKAFIEHMVENGFNGAKMIYEGKDLLQSSASAAVAMEAEAEEMTLALLKSAGISEKILNRYAKTANAYLAWHFLAFKGGKPSDLVKFYYLTERLLPITVNGDEFKNLPEYPRSITSALNLWNKSSDQISSVSTSDAARRFRD